MRAINLMGLCLPLMLNAENVGASEPPAKECAYGVVNRTECKILIRADGAGTPLPTKMKPDVTFFIEVEKTPFETIKASETATEQPRPDVLATIASALSKYLTGVVIKTTSSLEPDKPRAISNYLYRDYSLSERLQAVRPVPAPSEEELIAAELDLMQKKLLTLLEAQTALNEEFRAIGKTIEPINEALKQAEKLKVDRDASRLWQNRDVFRSTVNRIIKAIDVKDKDKGPADPALQALPSIPSERVALSQVEVTIVQRDYLTKLEPLEKRIDALRKTGSRDPSLKCEEGKNRGVEALDCGALAIRNNIGAVSSKQSQLNEKSKTAETAHDTLIELLPKLTALRKQITDKKDTELLSKAFQLKPPQKSIGIRGSTVKLSKQQIISKEASDIGTVTVSWNDSPWELSAGVLFSNLRSRSFQNTPVIQNGAQVLDSGGKGITVVTETTNRPVVIPVVLVHGRLPWDSKCGTRRCAYFGSLGIGSGTNGSADFMAGATFAWGNFMVSPMLHLARDIRLTNGVTVGQQISVTPPTEKYWVKKFGIAITYSLPIT